MQQTSKFFSTSFAVSEQENVVRVSSSASNMGIGGRGKSHFVIVLCSGALTGVLVGQKSVVSVITLAMWWHCK